MGFMTEKIRMIAMAARIKRYMGVQLTSPLVPRSQSILVSAHWFETNPVTCVSVVVDTDFTAYVLNHVYLSG